MNGSATLGLEEFDTDVRGQSVQPPPDGGYGWICVAACFSINCFTWGIVASYGVYHEKYLSHNVFPGATPTDFAFIGGLNFSMAMLVAPLVTIIACKRGTQFPVTIGVVLLATTFISTSFARRTWQLYISQSILVGFGVGFTYIPSIAILSQWFEKKQSLANGISAAGSGFGGLIFSFATEAMINQISLAWPFRITAIVACVANLTATLLIRNRNEHIRPPQRGLVTGLLRRYDVQLLLAWAFISIFGYITLLYSLLDFTRTLGLSSGQAATISTVLNVGTALGRPFIGVISDRYGRIEIAGILTFICGMTCFAIRMPARSYGLTMFFALISDAIISVSWVTVGPPLVEIAGLIAEVIALKVRRLVSGREYLYPQIFAGLAYSIASACLFELRRAKHKQWQQERGERPPL